MSAHNLPYQLQEANFDRPAPADGDALEINGSNIHLPLVITAENETNTLGDPTSVGQKITISCVSVANNGYRWITADSELNQSANTILKFAAARDRVVLESTYGTSKTDYEWLITANDGVSLG